MLVCMGHRLRLASGSLSQWQGVAGGRRQAAPSSCRCFQPSQSVAHAPPLRLLTRLGGHNLGDTISSGSAIGAVARGQQPDAVVA